MTEVRASRTLVMLQPPRIVIGTEALRACAEDLLERRAGRVLFVCSPSTRVFAEELATSLTAESVEVQIDDTTRAEPTVAHFEAVLEGARIFQPVAVVGLGGGSALDVAKLAAAMLSEPRRVSQVFGTGLLGPRIPYLACLPTTSGTGSEVSPNAILLDEAAQLKKGVISPSLVPDAAYCDPRMTLSLPAAVTAATGMDALTHCIEAFASRAAHAAVDGYALTGVRLIGANLMPVLREPNHLTARENMMIGSMYGGLCLGPVNTAGVHALSYPLGGKFHVPHGAANALLLPHVMEFSLEAAPQRYAAIAEALGVSADGDSLAVARRGVEHLRALIRESAIPERLRDWKIPKAAIPEMAASAMQITRLMKNNPRPIAREDAREIYRRAW